MEYESSPKAENLFSFPPTHNPPTVPEQVLAIRQKFKSDALVKENVHAGIGNVTFK